MNGGKPRWSSSSAARAHKPDRRSPSSMPPGPLAPSRTRHTPMRQDDVGLPSRSVPYKLRLRSRVSPAVARRRAAALAAQRAANPQGSVEDDLASTPTPESVLHARRGGRGASATAADAADEESSHFGYANGNSTPLILSSTSSKAGNTPSHSMLLMTSGHRSHQLLSKGFLRDAVLARQSREL